MKNPGEGVPKNPKDLREFPKEMPEVRTDLSAVGSFDKLNEAVRKLGGIKGYDQGELLLQIRDTKEVVVPEIYRKMLLGKEVDMDEQLRTLTSGNNEENNLRATFKRLLRDQIARSTEVIAKNIKSFEELKRIFFAMGLSDADLLADQIERSYSGYVGQLKSEVKSGMTELDKAIKGAEADFNAIYPNLGIGNFLSRMFNAEIGGQNS